MWIAVGYESKKIYAKGKTKAECCRKLQKKYPTSFVGPNHRNRKNISKVYPERLTITKRSR